VSIQLAVPKLVEVAEARAEAEDFHMSSSRETGPLLRSLAASKPGGLFLDGMDRNAKLITLEVHPEAAEISQEMLAGDPRAEVVLANGMDWLEAYDGPLFDLIFADVGRAKYERRSLTLSKLAPGGFFVCDDVIWSAEWDPEVRPNKERVDKFRDEIFGEKGVHVTLIDWGPGICVATRIADDAAG
jgi:predicted O-methyltransferase YrrM